MIYDLRPVTFFVCLCALVVNSSRADNFQSRFKETYASPLTVKRESIFEFAQKPQVTRQGDRVTIAFETKGLCDVTVAIEESAEKVPGTLTSGYLVPFPPIMLAAGPEGFYVHDHHGDETIRLYDRNGDYVRTVYPFPADKIDQVKMPRRTYPDGLSVPAKRGYFLATLLTGRENFQPESTMRISSEATAIHVRGTRLALASLRLNRMTTDGTSGGLDLYGPVVQGADSRTPVDYFPKQPHALAFSPDGKYLYLAGYVWAHCDLSGGYAFGYWAHAVLRMEYAKNDPPKVFLGKETERGADDAHFDHPTDVATDSAGRLYVSDQVNNRVQIFSPEGKLLKSLAVEGPARVRIHEKTQKLYVFCHFTGRDRRAPVAIHDADIKPTLRVFAPFPGLELRQACPIPLRRYQTTTGTNSSYTNTNMHYQFALDTWADPPRILAILEEGAYPELLELRKEGLVKVRDFLEEAKKSGVRLTLPGVTRQRMYVEPRSGTLYLSEGDSGSGKAFTSLVRIDPATGRCKIVELPFSASDAVFSPDGALYLRTGNRVGRYNLETGKEIPFDYGEGASRGSSAAWGSTTTATSTPTSARRSCGTGSPTTRWSATVSTRWGHW